MVLRCRDLVCQNLSFRSDSAPWPLRSLLRTLQLANPIGILPSHSLAHDGNHAAPQKSATKANPASRPALFIHFGRFRRSAKPNAPQVSHLTPAPPSISSLHRIAACRPIVNQPNHTDTTSSPKLPSPSLSVRGCGFNTPSLD